jgi:predicted dehydrogenase
MLSFRSSTFLGRAVITGGIGCAGLFKEKRVMSANLRIATIGASGHIAYVLDGLQADPTCTLVAAAQSEPNERLAPVLDSTAARRDQPKVYDDYRQMLDEVKPDIACVCMQYHRNAEGCIAAAEHGSHVICEKPIATGLDDLYRLRDVIKQTGVRLTALFGMRFEGHFLAARKAVSDGLIGQPVLASAQKSYKFGTRPDWYKDRRTYGGTIPWVAIHAIDFVRFVSGLEYTSVTAQHANKAHPDYPGLEDCGALLFGLSNGGQAVITFDYLRPSQAGSHGDDRLRVAGTEGILEVRPAEDLCEATTSKQACLELRHDENINLFTDFVKELRGQGQHLIGPDEPFRVTEVALKAREAADTGKTIALC